MQYLQNTLKGYGNSRYKKTNKKPKPLHSIKISPCFYISQTLALDIKMTKEHSFCSICTNFPITMSIRAFIKSSLIQSMQTRHSYIVKALKCLLYQMWQGVPQQDHIQQRWGTGLWTGFKCADHSGLSQPLLMMTDFQWGGAFFSHWVLSHFFPPDGKWQVFRS